MTVRTTFSLDLNANDLDALRTLLERAEAVAQAAAPRDPREQARIIDLLAEMKAQLSG
ncbi:hypothetical protein [Ectopseudomonas mendocina]|jgi:DNA-binding FadR family transcriptional regulator|uniref:hypothetical protein n=1 Tax=Ectopseudomonas mendocina TaxID=300 RepID=UPI00163D5527|nr:hypothetical protein [Pseudomonas mendocina]